MAVVTDVDLVAARGLPAEFMSLHAIPIDRVVHLVSKYWGAFTATAKVELVSALLPVLEPLAEPGKGPAARDRGTCEAIVATWLARQ